MTTRYVLFPGSVRSIFDGNTHYIGYERLIRLYKLNPCQCVNGLSQWCRSEPGDIRLGPRSDGNYSLPDSKG